ncbi:MAG: hypothetical protein ACE5JE_06150 [Thermoplasmata archaeon]
MALLLLFLFLPPLASDRGSDTDRDGIEDATGRALMDTHALILYFHPEETYFPVWRAS